MVIVVDLSQPDNMWLVLEKYLSTVRQRVDALASEVKQRNPELVSSLKEAAWDRIGPDHVVSAIKEHFMRSR
jgi:sugar-specific transcriptional regulator TrmB